MREDYTHITLVVDRSGSMATLRADAQGGINTLLDEQFDLDGKLTVTLVEFDTEIDTVKRMAKDSFEYTLVPRGGTALFDAVGQEIVRTGEDLARLRKSERPAKVLFVVVTDGEENSSHEYKSAQIKELVKHQENKYNWQFQFIGADQSAWQADGLGMRGYSYANTSLGTTNMYTALNTSTAVFRNASVDATFNMNDVDDGHTITV